MRTFAKIKNIDVYEEGLIVNKQKTKGGFICILAV